MNFAHIPAADAADAADAPEGTDEADLPEGHPSADARAPEGRLRLALEALLARESRAQAPEGEWREGLWFPSPTERRPCCEGLRPTPANKQALESHCRSAAHVAALYDVPVVALRRGLRRARYEREEAQSRPAAPPSSSNKTSSNKPTSNTERLARVSRAARSEAFADLRAEARQLADACGRLADLDESATAEEIAGLFDGTKSRLQATHESLENAMQMELIYRVSETAAGRLRASESSSSSSAGS